MDRLFRFSDYDVFAYIASGAIAIALIDLILSTHFIVGAQWTVAQGALTVFACYGLGQILATPAASILERVLVRRILGNPSVLLVSERPSTGWRGVLAKSILAEFYSPLDASVRKRLHTIMDAHSVEAGEALFWLAFPEVKEKPTTYSRMAAFLNLYGFARNIGFVLLVGGVSLLIAAVASPSNVASGERATWGALAILASLAMIHRYLKFLRLYSIEVLTTFDSLERRRS